MTTSSKYTAILGHVWETHEALLQRPSYSFSKDPVENAIRLASADAAHRVFECFKEALMASAGVTLQVPTKLEEAPEGGGSMSADQYLRQHVQQATNPQASEGPGSSET